MTTLLRLLAAVFLSAPSLALAGPSLRCAGGLVSEGDARIELLGKCGSPALEERRVDERWTAIASGHGKDVHVRTGRKVSVVVDEWTYDFGPNAFVHVVTLENGRITRVERRGYGYRREAPAGPVVPRRAACDTPVGISEGDRKLDVLERCGEPAVVDAWDESRSVVLREDDGAAGQVETIAIETWTYDLGRNRLVRFVRFENGRVTRVSTGSQGYAD